jgi:hypothetical protein
MQTFEQYGVLSKLTTGSIKCSTVAYLAAYDPTHMDMPVHYHYRDGRQCNAEKTNPFGSCYRRLA